MTHIVAIAGSPSDKSKSTALVRIILAHLEGVGFTTKLLTVRDFSPYELIYGAEQDSQNLKQVTEHIEQASAVIIVTPIYKASYSGALKAFLDLLPQKSLAGKVVLPLATGGSQKHLLAIEYALKPVLFALGATHVLGGLYISDEQVERDKYGQLLLDAQAQLRFDEQVDALIQALDRVAV